MIWPPAQIMCDKFIIRIGSGRFMAYRWFVSDGNPAATKTTEINKMH
jgi:hypothetical protein